MLVEGKPNLVVAFPGGKGMAGIVTPARNASIGAMGRRLVGAFLMAPKQHRCATRSGPLGVPAESSVRARYAQVAFLFKVRFWQPAQSRHSCENSPFELVADKEPERPVVGFGLIQPEILHQRLRRCRWRSLTPAYKGIRQRRRRRWAGPSA